MATNQQATAQQAPQGWRLDPAESYSDFVFEIASDGDGEVSTASTVLYHVHKYVLACNGERKFKYFESMFRSGLAETGAQRKCRIALPTLAARLIPRMLDYAYFPSKPLQIDTQSATPLYYLSDYFGNDSMRKEVIEFVNKDLSPDNCSYYYGQTKLVHNKVVPTTDPILDGVIQYCAKNIIFIQSSNLIMKEADVRFWLMVLEKVDVGNDNESTCKHLNLLIADICDLHIDGMTTAEFHELTKKDYLPFIYSICANRFLAHQSTVTEKEEGNEGEVKMRFGGNGCEVTTCVSAEHLPLDWSSKLDLMALEKDDEDENSDFILGDEEEDSDAVPLVYDTDVVEDELLGEEDENNEFDVDIYYDDGSDVDEQTNLRLRCIKALCLDESQISCHSAYFRSRPALLSWLYHGARAVAHKRELAWKLEKNVLRRQLAEERGESYFSD